MLGEWELTLDPEQEHLDSIPGPAEGWLCDHMQVLSFIPGRSIPAPIRDRHTAPTQPDFPTVQ